MDLAVILTDAVSVTSLPALPAGSNVIGHVIADSGSTTAVTSLPSLPAGASLIGRVDMAPSGAAWTDIPTVLSTGSSGGGLLVGAATGLRVRHVDVVNVNTGIVNIAFFNGPGVWQTSTNLIGWLVIQTTNSATRDFLPPGRACASGLYCQCSTGTWAVAQVAPAVALVFNGLTGV